MGIRELYGKVAAWVRFDGLLHEEVSNGIVVLMAAVSSPWLTPWASMVVGVISAVIAGLSKELYDKSTGRGTAEWHDVICDAAGILRGCMTLALLRL